MNAKNSKTKSEKTSTAFKSVRLDILEKPSGSEKALGLREIGQYVFLVKPAANKRMVREEIERRYGVSVRTVNMVGGRPKKAVVTLKSGQKIEI